MWGRAVAPAGGAMAGANTVELPAQELGLKSDSSDVIHSESGKMCSRWCGTIRHNTTTSQKKEYMLQTGEKRFNVAIWSLAIAELRPPPDVRRMSHGYWMPHSPRLLKHKKQDKVKQYSTSQCNLVAFLESIEPTGTAHRPAIFAEDSATARTDVGHRHCKSDWSDIGERKPHSPGEPATSEALAGTGRCSRHSRLRRHHKEIYELYPGR